MGKEIEMTITCRQCGKPFLFSESEQEFFHQKGFTLPTHCKECRLMRRTAPLLCSKCGTKLDSSMVASCAACTENVRIELEKQAQKLNLALEEVSLKLRNVGAEKDQLATDMIAKLASIESEKAQLSGEAEAKISNLESEKARLLQEAGNKLSDVESERARLASLVEQERRAAAELEVKLDAARSELEKALKYRADLDHVDPALNDIRNTLAVLGRTQEGISQTLLQWTRDIAEPPRNGSLLDRFKRILRIRRKSTSPVN